MSQEGCLFELDAKPELVLEAAGGVLVPQVRKKHNASDDEGHRSDLLPRGFSDEIASCRARLCPVAASCSSSSIWVIFSVSHKPEHLLHQIRTSPRLSTCLTKSCPPHTPSISVTIFPTFSEKNFVPVHFPGIFKYCLLLPHLMYRYLLASPHHSVRCFVSSLFLSTKINVSFGFGLSSSQSFRSCLRTARLRTLLSPAGPSLLSFPP